MAAGPRVAAPSPTVTPPTTNLTVRAPGGMTDPVALISGLDGVLQRVEAIAKVQADAMRDVRTYEQSKSRFMGSSTSRIEAIQDGLGVPAIRVVGPDAVGGPYAESPASLGMSAPVTRSMPPSSLGDPATREGWVNFPRSWAEGQSMTLSDARQGVAQRVEARLSQWAPGGEAPAVSATRRVRAGYEQIGPNLFRRRSDKQFVTPEEATWTQYRERETGMITTRGAFDSAQQAFASDEWKRVGAGKVKDIAAGLAEGEGLGVAATRAIPMVGVALGAAAVAQKGIAYAESQRAANAEFQAILGGSNAQGFGERARMYGFGLTQMGVLSSSDAQTIYKEGARIYAGRQGQRRQFEDFATSNYRALGVSPEDSARYAELAVQNGVESLTAMSDAIMSVSEAARKAGENAAVARQHFEESFADWATTISGGGAAALAAATTNVRTSLGQANENVTLGGADQTMMMRVAAANGMTLAQAYSRMQTSGANNAQVAATMMDQTRRQGAQHALGLVPGTQEYSSLLSRIQSLPRGRNGEISNEAWNDLAAQVQREFVQSHPGLDPQTLATMLGSGPGGQGVAENVTADQAFNIALRGLGNQLGVSEGVSESIRRFSRQGSLRGGINTRAGARLTRDLFRGTSMESMARNYGTGMTEFRSRLGDSGREGDIGRYMDALQRGAARDPVIESLLASGEYDSDRRFVVQTADGERQVTLGEAIENYRDQIANGGVRIAAGSGEGRTVAEVLRFEEGSTGVRVHTDSERARAGSEVDEGGGGNQHVTVTVVPDRKLNGWLRFNSDGTATDPNIPTDPNSGAETNPTMP